ncbi:MAG TPA: serine/threonine-protein kinase [Pirellulales bacterium]|nr:serine/threonine-protein kinase [Pirellulales bacterium]
MNDDACPSDDELLAAATDEAAAGHVPRHAATCPACRERLEELRREVGALRSFSGVSLPSHEAMMTRAAAGPAMADRPQLACIGRYVVVGEIASGGQADVYRVIDPDLARPLVLKLSRSPSGADEAHRKAAVAEGKLLATLDHPGLLRVFDAGEFEQRPYLVLEYVPGQNLEQRFARERPTHAEAARLICEAAQALSYAHSQGVVHGDITPRNMMVDAAGHTRLIDFGLARLEHIWQDGSFSPGGTPEFLPPELVSPDSLRRDGTASDVFGLGATFYWLVTGRGPFAAPTVVESLELARRGEIDFQPLRAARLPGRLMRWCMETLTTDPARRPTAAQSVKQLRPVAPMAAMRSKAVVIVVLLAALVLLETVQWLSNTSTSSTGGLNRSVVLSVPDVMVIRNDEVVNLSNVLPLRTGDHITIRFVVSPGEEVTVVWLDAAGKARRLSTARTLADEVDRIRYPESDRPITVTEPEGTDVIFVCRGAPIPEERLLACFPSQPPPPLPDQVLLQMQRMGVEPMGPLAPRSAEAAAVAEAETFLKAIDARLRGHFEGVRAVAFPHRPRKPAD